MVQAETLLLHQSDNRFVAVPKLLHDEALRPTTHFSDHLNAGLLSTPTADLSWFSQKDPRGQIPQGSSGVLCARQHQFNPWPSPTGALPLGKPLSEGRWLNTEVSVPEAHTVTGWLIISGHRQD